MLRKLVLAFVQARMPYFLKRFAFLLLFFLAITASFRIPYLFAANGEQYKIGREDVLEITVWQSLDLTKTVAVGSDGTIKYAFLGDIPVAGRTPQEVEKMLKEKLSQGYVKQPQVSVAVKEYNSKKILVFGEVVQPGLYKVKGKLPLLEMLFTVGGVKPDAKRMTIIRPARVSDDANPSQRLLSSEGVEKSDEARAIEVNLIALLAKGDLSQNIMIQPGDTIYVSSGTGERYYVLGQVKKPGPYEWVQDITVLEAIKLADGPKEAAALNRITVRKRRGNEEEVIKLNIVDIMKGKKKDDVIIKPGDVIVVPESWV